MSSKAFVCKNVMPGQGCDLPEMYFLGSLFWCSALVCIFLLYKHIKSTRKRWRTFDVVSLFWVTMVIWLVYRGLTSIFYYDWTAQGYLLGNTLVNRLLLFTSMCLVIYILFDLLFKYDNPGRNAIRIFQCLFGLFYACFLVLGVGLCFVEIKRENDPDSVLSLWCGCSDLIILIFFVLPAISLLKSVTYPMVQPDDICCVNFSKVGIVLYILIYGLRCIWNIFHYYDINSIVTWFDNELDKTEEIPNSNARVFTFFFFFIFDFMPSLLALISVYLFSEHDLVFNENPYFTHQSD